MGRKYKNPELQETYNWFLKNDPAPDTRGKGSMYNGYYIGRYLDTKRPPAVFGSFAFGTLFDRSKII